MSFFKTTSTKIISLVVLLGTFFTSFLASGSVPVQAVVSYDWLTDFADKCGKSQITDSACSKVDSCKNIKDPGNADCDAVRLAVNKYNTGIVPCDPDKMPAGTNTPLVAAQRSGCFPTLSQAIKGAGGNETAESLGSLNDTGVKNLLETCYYLRWPTASTLPLSKGGFGTIELFGSNYPTEVSDNISISELKNFKSANEIANIGKTPVQLIEAETNREYIRKTSCYTAARIIAESGSNETFTDFGKFNLAGNYELDGNKEDSEKTTDVFRRILTERGIAQKIYEKKYIGKSGETNQTKAFSKCMENLWDSDNSNDYVDKGEYKGEAYVAGTANPCHLQATLATCYESGGEYGDYLKDANSKKTNCDQAKDVMRSLNEEKNEAKGYGYNVEKTDEEATQVKSDLENQGSNTTDTIQKADEECEHYWDVGCQLKKFGMWLFEKLINFIIFVFLLVMWFLFFVINFFADLVFNFIASFADYLLLVNPASDAYIDVSKSLFGVMVSLANMLILFMFLAAGFGRIAGFMGGQKKPLSEFFTSVAIIAVLINFSFYAVAGVISLSYQVGYMFYQGMNLTKTNNTTADDKCPTSQNPFMSLKDTVSCVIKKDEQIAALNDKYNADSNEPYYYRILPGFMRTFMITIILILGIYAMVGLIKYLLSRFVIMFFLLVTAPIGAVLYFSSYDRFKQYGEKWMELLFTTSITYPFIIITISIGSSLVSRVGRVLQDLQIIKLESATMPLGTSGSVDVGWLTTLAPVIMPALVGIAVMLMIKKFVDTQMNGIAGQLYNGAVNGVKEGIGGAWRVGKGAYKIGKGGYRAGATIGGLVSGGLKGGYQAATKNFGTLKDYKQKGVWGKTKSIAGAGWGLVSGGIGGAIAGGVMEGVFNRTGNKAAAFTQGKIIKAKGWAEGYLRDYVGDDQYSINALDKVFGNKSLYSRMGASGMAQLSSADRREARDAAVAQSITDYYGIKPSQSNLTPRINALADKVSAMKSKDGKFDFANLSEKDLQDLQDFMKSNDKGAKILMANKLGDVIGSAQYQEWLSNNNQESWKNFKETMPTLVNEEINGGSDLKEALRSAVENPSKLIKEVVMADTKSMGLLLSAAKNPDDKVKIAEMLNSSITNKMVSEVENAKQTLHGKIDESLLDRIATGFARDFSLSPDSIKEAFNQKTSNGGVGNIVEILEKNGAFQKQLGVDKVDGRFTVSGDNLEAKIDKLLDIGGAEKIIKAKIGKEANDKINQEVTKLKAQNPKMSAEELKKIQKDITKSVIKSNSKQMESIVSGIESYANGLSEMETVYQNYYNKTESKKVELELQKQQASALKENNELLKAVVAARQQQSASESTNTRPTSNQTSLPF